MIIYNDIKDTIEDNLLLQDEEYTLEVLEYEISSTENIDYLANESDKFFSNTLPSINLSSISKREKNKVAISINSIYSDEKWCLESKSQKTSFIFTINKYKNTEVIDFFKTILYYAIPENHPTGKIKSLETTRAYGEFASILQKNLFEKYQILKPNRDIKNITLKQFVETLEQAKKESSTKYLSLFYILSFWLTLTEHNLLPPEYKIPVKRSQILDKERRKDIFKNAKESLIGWEPFNEYELSKLIDFINPLITKIKPGLDELNQYHIQQGFIRAKNSRVIRRKSTELFKEVNLYAIDNSSGYNQLLRAYRLGVIIYLALLTGLRKRELSELKFSDVSKINIDQCKLDITRFKTSIDPSNFGDSDYIILPIEIFELIETLKQSAKSWYGVEPEYLSYSSKEGQKKRSTGFQTEFKQLSKKLGFSLGFHRFRKTTATLLISESEKNIELIRFLFGHKSYVMTLHYISRNPFLVEEITSLMQGHYCKELTGLLSSIISNKYSGTAGNKIAKSISENPNIFSGKRIHSTVKEYISAMLNAGEPLFIHQIPLGGKCISVPIIGSKATPCTKKLNYTDRVKPDVSMCESEFCSKAVFTEESLPALNQNVIFYKSLLDNNGKNLSKNLHKKYSKLLEVTIKHISNITDVKSHISLDNNG